MAAMVVTPILELKRSVELEMSFFSTTKLLEG